jgi:hypothetical protein
MPVVCPAILLAQQPAAVLFEHVVATPVIPDCTQEVGRAQVVDADIELLLATEVGDAFVVNPFSEIHLEGTVERIESRGAHRRSVSGSFPDFPLGSFSIVVEEDAIAATFRIPEREKLFTLRYGTRGELLACEIDEGRFPRCAGGHATGNVPPIGPTGNGETSTAAVPRLDLLVLYTPAARSATGGTNAILALTQLAVDETNQAYASSGIVAEVRLAGAEEIPYVESGNTYSEHLYHLAAPNDGVMDQAHALRSVYAADQVTLLVEDGTYCGIAYGVSDASTAFTVVHRGCATGNYSFGHELGHNLGCDHEREHAAGCALYSYSYGWKFIGLSGTTFRTIMAYPPGTRIQRFSNPDVFYDGVATGVPIGNTLESHNAWTITQRAPLMEGFSIGEIYCIATPNSTGSSAEIFAYGSPSSSAGALSLAAAPVPDQHAVLFHAAQQGQWPFGNGFMCAYGQVVRGAVTLASGHLATYAYDNSDAQHSLAAFIGATRNFQYWFRDPMGGGAFFNTSNAISILIEP